VNRAVELPKDVSERLKELEKLSEKAEGGDQEARRELRRAVKSSAPEVIARASDIARTGQRVLARTAAANDPLIEEALCAKLDVLRAEIAGEDPTPLEALLSERVVSCWMLTTLLEVLMAGQFIRGQTHRVAPVYLLQMARLQESASRRYLAAIEKLARVRKLQANTPGIQFNTQINLGGRQPVKTGNGSFGRK
jgi:hypothetical protein